MYNTVGAPGEFFPLASVVKRQLIYYLYVSNLIYPTRKNFLMKSTIVRLNAREINTSFYFFSSCSDAHWFVPSKTLLM